MTIHYTCMKKWILPKIRALMTLKARMTGKMVGIIMGAGTGAGTVVTAGTVATGTVVTEVAPPTPVEMAPPVI